MAKKKMSKSEGDDGDDVDDDDISHTGESDAENGGLSVSRSIAAAFAGRTYSRRRSSRPAARLPPICPHVTANTRVSAAAKQALFDPGNWQCRECGLTEVWTCLACGFCGCEDSGDNKGHALDHCEEHPDHLLYIDVNNCTVVCMACDLSDEDRTVVQLNAALKSVVSDLAKLINEGGAPEQETQESYNLRRREKLQLEDMVDTAAVHFEKPRVKQALSNWRARARESISRRRLSGEVPVEDSSQTSSEDEVVVRVGTRSPVGRRGARQQRWSGPARTMSSSSTVAMMQRGPSRSPARQTKKNAQPVKPPAPDDEESPSTPPPSKRPRRSNRSGGAAAPDSDGEERPASRSRLGRLREGEFALTQSTAKSIVRGQWDHRDDEELDGTVSTASDADLAESGGVGRRRRPAKQARAGTVAQTTQAKRTHTRALTRQGRLKRGEIGIRNMGNTCFMASVLQALSFTPAFRDFFIKVFLGDQQSGAATRVGKSALVRVDTVDCLELMKHKQQRRARRAPNEFSVSFHLHALLRVLWSGQFVVISPFSLLEAVRRFFPQFNNYKQQDAQEFIVSLFDRVHTELTDQPDDEADDDDDDDDDGTTADVSSESGGGHDASANGGLGTADAKQSIVTDVFQGRFLSEVQCSGCNRVSTTSETFLDLSLDIPVVSVAKQRSSRRSLRSRGIGSGTPPSQPASSVGNEERPSCKLEQCLESFTAYESLTDYQCDHCTTRQAARKRLIIAELPPVLCVVLKRFCWWDKNGAKIDTNVRYPVEALDLSPFLSQEAAAAAVAHSSSSFGGSRRRLARVPELYDLYSVVAHQGTQLKSGHYTAFCCSESGTWLHFNDQKVKEVDEAQVLEQGQGAYLLFYRKRAL